MLKTHNHNGLEMGFNVATQMKRSFFSNGMLFVNQKGYR
jgi:hypothetical protein